MINEEGRKMTPREIIQVHAYPVLAAVSTISLVTTSFFLVQASNTLKNSYKHIEPISVWAQTQNECVERTFRLNGKDTRGLPSKVWSCNGGGE